MAEQTMQQQDLITDLLASHSQVGRLAWFTVDDGLIDQNQWVNGLMQAGLTAYGQPQGIPDGTAYLRGLRTMQSETAGRTLLRRVIREKGRTVHHWIEESIQQGTVQFRPLAAIARDTKYGHLDVHLLDTLTSAQQDALAGLNDFVDLARHTYTPGGRRRQVRQWFAKVGALQMSHAGPMQFIPEEAVGLIDAMTRAQTDLGVHVWSMPLSRSKDVIDTLQESLDDEITKKTTALLKSIQKTREAGKTPTTGQQTKLVEQLQDLDRRIQRYSGIFDEHLDSLTNQISIARQAVRGALGE